MSDVMPLSLRFPSITAEAFLFILGLQSRFGDNWGQNTWNLSGLFPKRDWTSIGVRREYLPFLSETLERREAASMQTTRVSESSRVARVSLHSTINSRPFAPRCREATLPNIWRRRQDTNVRNII